MKQAIKLLLIRSTNIKREKNLLLCTASKTHSLNIFFLKSKSFLDFYILHEGVHEAKVKLIIVLLLSRKKNKRK